MPVPVRTIRPIHAPAMPQPFATDRHSPIAL
jgi:hypothetical protein